MKFRHINIKNFMWLVPPWIGADRMSMARALDEVLVEAFETPGYLTNRRANFMVYMKVDIGQVWAVPQAQDTDAYTRNAVMTVTEVNNPSLGTVFIGGTTHPFGAPYSLVFMLWNIMKETKPLDGTHTVYVHTLRSDVPLNYIGVTRRPWYVRFAEHINAARKGSSYIFHEAIRQHQNLAWHTRPMDVMFDYDRAMKYEEGRIHYFKSLYPLGLNMIPGGYAGLRYLHKLGIHAKTVEDRDLAMQRLVSQESVNGRPNPLCAARWATDQDYVNRVICGGPGRLSVEQVRAIRMHSSFGLGPHEIAALFNMSKVGQIMRAWRGNTYSRVQ